MKPKLRHLELFAGIGGFRQAIDRVCKDHGVISHCVGYSELDKYADTAYRANYNTDGEVALGDIGEFTTTKNKIKQLPDFDLLTGGFPCQSFSMMGKQHGLKDERGNLFYSIVKILIEKQPRYILLENVRNLQTHDEGKTYREVIRSLDEDAGYDITTGLFNTADFGLPQNRRRVFIFGIRKDHSSESPVTLDPSTVKTHFEKHKNGCSLNFYHTVLDSLLSDDVPSKYYLSRKIKPTILANGSKNFKSKSEINQIIARPLTATMVKMHRACQDNYYCDEFLNADDPIAFSELKFPKEEIAKREIRRLTPLEALKLQGFDEIFHKRSVEAGLSDTQIYRQAGNAVSINTVYFILHYLLTENILTVTND